MADETTRGLERALVREGRLGEFMAEGTPSLNKADRQRVFSALVSQMEEDETVALYQMVVQRLVAHRPYFLTMDDGPTALVPAGSSAQFMLTMPGTGDFVVRRINARAAAGVSFELQDLRRDLLFSNAPVEVSLVNGTEVSAPFLVQRNSRLLLRVRNETADEQEFAYAIGGALIQADAMQPAFPVSGALGESRSSHEIWAQQLSDLFGPLFPNREEAP